MLTTWASTCGIAEYSANLVKEFSTIDDMSVIVFGNRYADKGLARIEPNGNPFYYFPGSFGVTWWHEAPGLDVESIFNAVRDLEIDILHVQYQGSLYMQPHFNELIKRAAELVPVTCTLHDSSLQLGTNLGYFNRLITHKSGITKLPHKEIGFPIPVHTPAVFSFGMGRNDYDLIEKVCKELGIKFDKHDGRVDGWLESEALNTRMRLADVIVLWYNEVGIVGGSSAARAALSSFRPVIVNNVGWFDDLGFPYIHTYSEEDLKATIREVLHIDYMFNLSYENCANKYIEMWEELL